MKHRTSIAISGLLHAVILIYLIMPTRATYTPPKQYMNVNLNDVIVEEPQPKPPEPEPEKPKPEPKINEETIQMIQTRVVPTPKPTKTPTQKPTQTPTKKPSSTPTKAPTQKPSPKPTTTKAPTSTHSPMPSPTPQPSSTPTPVLEIVSFENLNLLTPQPTTTGKPAFDYGSIFSEATGMSDEDKNSYGAKLSNHLQRFWRQPRTVPQEDRDYSTIISFVIDKKGNVTDAKILTPSGWALMDKTVADALKAANPVPPLPPTFPSDSVQVRVPFVLQKR